ncbi:class I SAM-dependent methyltransferase [Micromonospora sp. WMMD714]|uniref:class I SAM-dependent methyltransferase n=1 Tax=Micromonospora sp. WMMD714 TaxID=3016097 RepID=UPI00249C32A1|nr:class I SAM-dependent methyltransferase [Micromonospora sp. WMMD714]WFE65730.1 methyltransferase domain-containing protein [Micromonospora sp. WMMD714]
MSTTSQFTERDVSEFFDQTTQTYLSFWDSEGVLHTGYFAGPDDTDYPAAADRTSDLLATEAGIDASATVLDVGCGCGNFLLRLAERTGCRGEGVDLSIERVRFALGKLTERGDGLPVAFRHGSATALPYDDGGFSHVVSQDALFLVPDKARSHAEMYRVLAPGGTLAVTDFLQPVAEIGEAARRHVYDRVRWSSGYSLDGYREALTAAGFEVTVARSLDTHIRQTYRVLGETARQRAAATDDEAARQWILGFAASCDEIQAAIDRGEFGWGMFVARKPA